MAPRKAIHQAERPAEPPQARREALAQSVELALRQGTLPGAPKELREHHAIRKAISAGNWAKALDILHELTRLGSGLNWTSAMGLARSTLILYAARHRDETDLAVAIVKRAGQLSPVYLLCVEALTQFSMSRPQLNQDQVDAYFRRMLRFDTRWAQLLLEERFIPSQAVFNRELQRRGDALHVAAAIYQAIQVDQALKQARPERPDPDLPGGGL